MCVGIEHGVDRCIAAMPRELAMGPVVGREFGLLLKNRLNLLLPVYRQTVYRTLSPAR